MDPQVHKAQVDTARTRHHTGGQEVQATPVLLAQFPRLLHLQPEVGIVPAGFPTQRHHRSMAMRSHLQEVLAAGVRKWMKGLQRRPGIFTSMLAMAYYCYFRLLTFFQIWLHGRREPRQSGNYLWWP